jgi:hypothetical protein
MILGVSLTDFGQALVLGQFLDTLKIANEAWNVDQLEGAAIARPVDFNDADQVRIVELAQNVAMETE